MTDLEKVFNGEYTSKKLINKLRDNTPLTDDEKEAIACVLIVADKLKNVIEFDTYMLGLRFGISFINWDADTYKEFGCVDIAPANDYILQEAFTKWLYCEGVFDREGNDLRHKK